jgi:hypothetical protein
VQYLFYILSFSSNLLSTYCLLPGCRFSLAAAVSADHCGGFRTSAWMRCGMLKRLGTWLRRTRQPSAPDAGVQLEKYDSHLPGTERPARTPPAPTQGCHWREAPARGQRCSVSRPGSGRRQLGNPARSQDGSTFPTRTPAVRAGSVGRSAGRKGLP